MVRIPGPFDPQPSQQPVDPLAPPDHFHLDMMTRAAHDVTPHKYTPFGPQMVVAANDTLNPGQANYRCDGVDDHLTVQEAVDALPDTGGTVTLLPGTYTFGNPTKPMDVWTACVAIPSNVVIQGMGQGATVVTFDQVNKTLDAVMFAMRDVSDAILRDMTLWGAATEIQAIQTGDAFDNDFGVYIERGARCSVINVEGYDFNVSSNAEIIHIKTGSNACRITECYLHESDGCLDDNGAGTVIARCYFYRAGQGGVGSNAVELGGTGAILRDCFFDESLVFPAIGLRGANNLVTGNYFEDVALRGVLISGLRNDVIDNRFVNPGDEAIHAGGEHSQILGNLIYAGQTYGIEVSGPSNIIANNLVFECSRSADATYDGILIGPNTNGAADNNLVTGNLIRRGSTFRHRYGINVAASGNSENIITNNDLFSSGITGYLNDAGTKTVAYGNRNSIGTFSDTSPWETVTLQNGWTNHGSPWQTARYRMEPGRVVRIQGLVNASAATANTIFTLPASYRPSSGHIQTGFSSGGAARFDVRETGVVTAAVLPATWLSIECTFVAS